MPINAEALLAFRQGRLPEAEQRLRQMVGCDPHDADTRALLGLTLARMGRLPEARLSLEAAMRLDPASFDAALGLSKILLGLGEIKAATEAAQRAVALRMTEPEALKSLSQCFAAAGDVPRAREVLRSAVQLAPRSSEIRAQLAAIYAQLGDVDGAIEEYGAALDMVPEDNALRSTFAGYLLSVGRAVEATVQYRRVLAKTPKSPEILGSLGFSLQAQGQFEEATIMFERSLAIAPAQGHLYSALAYSLPDGQGRSDLLTRVQRALQETPLSGRDRFHMHFALGKLHEKEGRYADAIGAFDRANEIAYESVPSVRAYDPSAHAATYEHFKCFFTPTRLQAGLPPLSTVGPRPIFIVGAIRSGTTLVEQIVSSHPDVSAAGELEFWLREGMSALRSARGHLSGDLLTRLRESYQARIGVFARGASWVTDKMPQNYQMIGLIHLAFPDAPILFVRRNPLDNCISIWTTPFERSPDYVHNKANIIGMYRLHDDLVRHWQTVLPAGRILEVPYEDLVADRESWTRRILDYCGLPWNDVVLSPERNDRAVFTASFWQARQPVNRRSIERWRRYEPWLGEFQTLCP